MSIRNQSVSQSVVVHFKTMLLATTAALLTDGHDITLETIISTGVSTNGLSASAGTWNPTLSYFVAAAKFFCTNVAIWPEDTHFIYSHFDNAFYILQERIVTACHCLPSSSFAGEHVPRSWIKKVCDNKFWGNYKLDFKMTEWHFPSQYKWFIIQRQASKHCEMSFSALW